MLDHIAEGFLRDTKNRERYVGRHLIWYICVSEIDLDAVFFCELTTQRIDTGNESELL